jgi:hypothetical protein
MKVKSFVALSYGCGVFNLFFYTLRFQESVASPICVFTSDSLPFYALFPTSDCPVLCPEADSYRHMLFRF